MTNHTRNAIAMSLTAAVWAAIFITFMWAVW